MTRKLLAALTVALLAAPAALSAQIHTGLSLAGGLSAPSGDMANSAKSGYNLAAGLNVGVPLLPVGLRIEGAYNAFDSKATATTTAPSSLNIASGTVNGTFGLGLPYAIGGLGYYSSKATATTGTTTISSDRVNALGLNGGIGMRFPLGVISTFAEVRYHKMMGDAAKGAAASYIPITFGINF